MTLPLSYSRSSSTFLISPEVLRSAQDLAALLLLPKHSAVSLNVEPMTRIELVTSPLPRECSTN